MEAVFTPNEAAAFAYLSPKRVYKELEYRVIESNSEIPRLPFVALIYLRALKEIDFEFSVNYRTLIYQRLVKAWENHASNLEIAKFFVLQLDQINQELRDLIVGFNRWQEGLVSNAEVKGGEMVFPNSRLSVRHLGGILERGESPEVILEDYPYLTAEDLQFASLYVKAYPVMGRPKKG